MRFKWRFFDFAPGGYSNSSQMTDSDRKLLASDPDGLKTYEYIANHIDTCRADIDELVENIARVDLTGQFLASAARYLHAIDPEVFAEPVRQLVALTIDRDREHRYLADILQSIYGADYMRRASELQASDNNFRRIYKRLFPSNAI